MKFSIVSTVLLAQGIAAMPWSNVKAARANGEEITLRIHVSQGSSATRGPGMTTKPNGVVNTKLYDVCFRVCWPEEPTCPEGWNSKNLGKDYDPCWTCCKSAGDDEYL
ncbi:hypothetical protein ACLX1H_008930 [Fusarium chlamydosporum]